MESRPKNSGPKNSRPKESGPMESRPKNSGPKNSRPKESGPMESGPMESGPMESEAASILTEAAIQAGGFLSNAKRAYKKKGGFKKYGQLLNKIKDKTIAV
jgi:hypothetical protein